MKKKLFALLLAGCMVFSMTACAGKEESAETNENAATEESAQIDTSALGTSKLTELGEYKGLSYKPMDTTVTDEEVEAEIQYMVANSFTKNPQDVATETSVVNIDYVGKKDDVAFEGGTAQGYDLIIGSGMFVPGFEDGLIGANIGETRDVALTFPENYHSEDLAGQDVVFTVTINSITASEPAELNDEFVAQFGSANVEEFKNSIVGVLEQDALATYEEELQMQIIDKLLAECKFADELPNDLMESYKDQIYSNFEMYASQYGMDVDTYVKASDMTMEEFEENVLVGATDSVKEVLVCKVIADKENIEVTDEELEQNIQDNYANFGYATPEEYKENENVEEYRDYLLTAKVLSFIIDNADITILPIEEAETATEAEVTTEAE